MKRPELRRPLDLLLLLLTLLASGSAQASDGTLEINQTCAVHTGCFPGDAAGFPVTITVPGSYVLTSNLVQNEVPLVSTPMTAIEIASRSVTVDFAGFEITCRNPLGGLCNGSAAGIEQATSFVEAVTIVGGTIRQMPGYGIDLRGADYITVRDMHIVRNGGRGISIRDGANVSGNNVHANAEFGIHVGFGLVRDNVVVGNQDTGIVSVGAAHVIGNTILGNINYGVNLGAGSLRNNLIRGNGTGSVVLGTGAIDAGGNACNETTTCP